MLCKPATSYLSTTESNLRFEIELFTLECASFLGAPKCTLRAASCTIPVGVYLVLS